MAKEPEAMNAHLADRKPLLTAEAIGGYIGSFVSGFLWTSGVIAALMVWGVMS